MKKLKQIASADAFEAAVETAEQCAKQRTAKANELSNKTYANSLIYSKQKQTVSETSLIDFALALLASVSEQFHKAQVLEVLKLVECSRTTVSQHIKAKREFRALLSVNDDIITVENKEFFAHLVCMSEFQQQLLKFAEKFYILLVDEDYLDSVHAEAICMNESTKKKAAKKTEAFCSA